MGGPSDSKVHVKAPQWVHALAGGLAGAVSRLVVGPLDVVKIRMQVQLEPIAHGVNSKYTGVMQALTTIVREEGVQVRACRPSCSSYTLPSRTCSGTTSVKSEVSYVVCKCFYSSGPT